MDKDLENRVPTEELRTQAGTGDLQQRALRKVGSASSALTATPSGFESARSTSRGNWVWRWKEGAGPSILTETEVRLQLGRRRRHSILVPNRRPRLQENRQPPAGPPYLLLIPLYDWRSEGLYKIFDGFALQLDRATSISILIELLGNPSEFYSLYDLLRSVDLAKLDEADVRAHLRRLRKGRREADSRRIEVDKLAQILGISAEQLPCLAVLPLPLSLPVGVVPVRQEWICTRQNQVRFATALELFFKTHDIRRTLCNVTTNVGLANAYVREMNKWLGRLARVDLIRRKRPRRRATRTATADAMKEILRDCLRSAHDHAQSLREKGRPPELLPRPEQAFLAKLLDVSRSTISRTLRDKRDRELIMLWEALDDLEQVLRYRP